MKADATGAMQRLRWPRLLHVAIVAAAMLSGPAATDERDQLFTEGRLWRISRAGVADSFVFGTIHVNDPRVSAIPEPVANALARSRSLLLELATTAVVDEHTIDLEE